MSTDSNYGMLKVVGGLRWTRKLYSECVDRHVHFELCYAPMIRNSEDRRRVMSQVYHKCQRILATQLKFLYQALNYQAVGRSRSIVLSGEARSPLELRSPGTKMIVTRTIKSSKTCCDLHKTVVMFSRRCLQSWFPSWSEAIPGRWCCQQSWH